MVVSKNNTQRNGSGTWSGSEQNTSSEQHTKDTSTERKPVTNSGQSGILKPSTSVYIGKKTTGVHDIGKKMDLNDTGLNTVSIDTDTFNENDEAQRQKSIEAMSIDTGTFTPHNLGAGNYPVIIDETESGTDMVERNVQASLIKKEKVPPKNITIDITSEFHHPVLPSENTKEQLGSGVVVGALGSGGMAKVYKTWNEKLEIFRAVKILMPTNQKEPWDRFVTEAKITAKLHHPNIIETYDIGDWHDLPFIEMEFIEGDTLADLLAKNRNLPSPVCAAIALQVAKALAYAHSQEIMIYGKKYQGIIHRDLKPSNIMVTANGDVKLMDFGVARPIEAGLHTIATDSIVGTVHYFSPEQIAGYPVDIFTDIYSYGAVLYELLSGQNPFPQSNMVQLVQAKTRNQFVRLEDFNIEMDFRLTSVAQTCLRTDKRERYENCNLIRHVLEDVVNSYNLGTPEQIVELFYNNPDIVNQQFERFSHFEQYPQMVAPEPVEEPMLPVYEEESAHLVESAKQTSTSFVATRKKSETDLWEKKVKSHNLQIFLTVILLLVMLAGGVFFVTEKGVLTDSFKNFRNTADGNDGAVKNSRPVTGEQKK